MAKIVCQKSKHWHRKWTLEGTESSAMGSQNFRRLRRAKSGFHYRGVFRYTYSERHPEERPHWRQVRTSAVIRRGPHSQAYTPSGACLSRAVIAGFSPLTSPERRHPDPGHTVTHISPVNNDSVATAQSRAPIIFAQLPLAGLVHALERDACKRWQRIAVAANFHQGTNGPAHHGALPK